MVGYFFQQILNESPFQKYQLTTEVCTAGQCIRGECRERVELSDQQMTILTVDGVGFVAPSHSRYAECTCPEGYAVSLLSHSWCFQIYRQPLRSGG